MPALAATAVWVEVAAERMTHCFYVRASRD
jgi:hypothetical protein